MSAEQLQRDIEEGRQFWSDVEFDRLPRCPECNSQNVCYPQKRDSMRQGFKCKACGFNDPTFSIDEASDAHN